jgi:AraC-like DNA-binding protein
MSENLWMNPAGWLVSRALTEKAGPWDERLSMDDDGEYFARVVAASEKVRFVRESRCYYRQSGFQQLSRDMTERASRSLILSTTLRIQNLLALEKTYRTRGAALALLQIRLPVFYPEKTEMLERMNALASELGAELAAPRFGWRSSLLQRLFGPEKGKGLMTSLRRLRMGTAVKWDEWMSRLGR